MLSSPVGHLTQLTTTNIAATLAAVSTTSQTPPHSQPTALAIMAQNCKPATAHPQHGTTAIAMTPPRRTTQIAPQVFPFADLPPELRNRIYSLTLQCDLEPNGFFRLVDGPRAAAKTLSQVSRAIRTESMGIYYSENIFLLEPWCAYWIHGQAALEYRKTIREWASIWGKIAAPHLRTIAMSCYGNSLPDDCEFDDFSIRFDHPTEPVSYNPHPGNCPCLGKDDMNALILALTRLHGTAKKLTGPRLEVLLAGLVILSYPDMMQTSSPFL